VLELRPANHCPDVHPDVRILDEVYVAVGRRELFWDHPLQGGHTVALEKVEIDCAIIALRAKVNIVVIFV
jgi:hypothetical protein